MLNILWDTRGYFFWLLVILLLCFALERFWPWRRQQPALRPQLGQDVVWLVLTWGPLRYVFNSPRMHIWHHDHAIAPGHPKGVNFGICLSLWDWFFGTAHWPGPEHAPTQQPQHLGFEGLDRYPRSFLERLVYPFTRLFNR